MPTSQLLRAGTTLPLIPPDFQIGICKKENNHADLTRTRSAPDTMKNPVCWVVLTGISIAFIQQGKMNLYGRFKYYPESFFFGRNISGFHLEIIVWVSCWTHSHIKDKCNYVAVSAALNC